MSSIFKKYIKEKKDYKKLYESELSNRKKYEERYKELKQENIELQKSSGIADLRVKIKKLGIELEDKTLLYHQEKVLSTILIERHKKIKEILKKIKNKKAEECLSFLDGLRDEELLDEIDKQLKSEEKGEK